MRPLNKWATFGASIPVALSSGVVYCFSVWSEELKEAYGLTQSQLQLIGAAANMGGLLAILAGLLYDALIDWHQLGPRLVLVLGSLLNLGGYLFIWAAITQKISPPYWQLLITAALACSGNSWSDAVGLVTNVRNLPQHRGTVVGIMKSCVGLSASVYTALYLGVFEPDARRFVLFLAFAPTLVYCLGAPLIGHVPYIQHSELKRRGRRTFTTERRFAYTLIVLSTLAVCLGVGAVVSPHVSPAVRTAFVGLLLLLLLPLAALPIRSGGLFSKPWEPHHAAAAAAAAAELAALEQGHDDSAGPRRPLLEPSPGSNAGDSALTSHPIKPAPTGAAVPPPQFKGTGVQLAPLALLRAVDFWLLFVPCFTSMGVGLVFINNAAQLVQSLHQSPAAAAPLLSLFSVFNFFGRVATGWYSEKRLHADGAPRPQFLVAYCAAMPVVCLGFALSSPSLLPPVAAATGFCFGGIWTLMSTLVSELFGMRHFASNYCLFQAAPGLGSYLLATRLAGGLYARAMAAQEQAGTTCRGAACFRDTWLILAVLGLAGVACATALHRRTAPAYRREYEELHAFDILSDDDDDDDDEEGERNAAA